MSRLLRLAEEHGETLFWVSSGSFVMFVGTLLLVPLLVARAPADFFVREARPERGPLALLGLVLRNLLGALLLVSGVLMLVLPGQGLLTLLLALSLLDVPGKRALVRRIARRPRVWRALAYVRERMQRPPFLEP